MKRLLLALAAVCSLALPAQAAANITALDPSVLPGSAITTGQALLSDPDHLDTATLTEYAFGGSGAPSPIGIGDKTLDPDPKGLVGFPTAGDTFGILSSGEINTIGAELTNESASTGFLFTSQFAPFPPDPNRGTNARDWTVLKLDVTVPANTSCMTLDYRFLSEEFPEFVGSSFNDAFIAELDTTSWSVGSGGALTRPNDWAVSPLGSPVSINGVGDTAVFASEATGTYFDSATGLITTKTPITPGAHSIYLSIFDASDKDYDSAVFLDDLSFISESAATCKPPTGKQIAPPPPGKPAPPSNKFTPGSSAKFGKTGSSATLTVNVPGPGVLTAGSTKVGAATATAAEAARIAAAQPAAKAKGKACPKGKKRVKGKCVKKKKPKVKKPLLKSSTVTATQAGPVNITVSLSATGKAVLAKKGKLTIPVTLTFTPTGGTPASQVQSVTFKRPKCGKGKKRVNGKCVKKKSAKKGKGGKK